MLNPDLGAMAWQHQTCQDGGPVPVPVPVPVPGPVPGPVPAAVTVEHTKLPGTAMHWDPIVWVGASASLKPKG